MNRSKYDHLSIVPVIAAFDCEGHIKPLYIRIGNESFQVHSSSVKSCYSGILEFDCRIIDRRHLRPLILTYFPQDRVWAMPKAPAS